jgi:hypothetical protein
VPALNNIAIPVAFTDDSVSLPSCKHEDMILDGTKHSFPSCLLYCNLQSIITSELSDTVKSGREILTMEEHAASIFRSSAYETTVSQPTMP